MTQSQWWGYVERLMDARGWTPADLSRASGVDQSVIGRWRDRAATPSPENVRRVATAFGRDIREAIIASTHYTAAELAGTADDPPAPDLSVLTHEELRDEIYARMRISPQAVARRRRVPAGDRPEVNTDATTLPSSSGRDEIEIRHEPLPEPPADDRSATHPSSPGDGTNDTAATS
jgi:transcriptional regulator with XRE-family HTH domain